MARLPLPLGLAAALLLGGACIKDRFTEPPPPPTEDNDDACSDDVDNDGDGLIDCVDKDCYPGGEPVSVCAKTVDAEVGEALCGDGIDNDGDGYFDCDDKECNGDDGQPAVRFCIEADEESCSDDNDNNGNGFIDCADFSCQSLEVCR
ncbi:MAG: hypothetical protein R3B72_37330 [Polyangiaceae bacterium]